MDGEEQGTPGPEPGDGWEDDGEGRPLRGWISPDDRLWRHPSEAGSHALTPAAAPVVGPQDRRTRPGPWLLGGATACIVVAIAAVALVMTTTGSGDDERAVWAPGAASLLGSPTTEPAVSRVAGESTVADMVTSLRPSTVLIRVVTGTGVTTAMGLVAESGGIIVTAAAAVAGARSITVTESDGNRQSASLIGSDTPSGLAVVQIGDDLPVATFTDGDLATGEMALAMALVSGGHAGVPSAVVYAGPVISAGQSLGAPAAGAFAGTEVRAALSTDDVGCPLLDSRGEVVGMLERITGSGSSSASVFLSAQVVAGVTEQLVASGAVDHGWLGVEVDDPGSPPGRVGTPATGARLTAVEDGSPATGELLPGDVITAVNGDPVVSSAELRTRLYADPPGTDVQITVARGDQTVTVPVILADRDAGVAGPDPSP